MAIFDYNINVVGDCSGSGSGSISIEFTGGTAPYTVNWVSPNLGYDITSSLSVRNDLYQGTYIIEVNDSTVPTNQNFFINIPVSAGCCVSIDYVSDTTCGFDNGSVTGTSTSYFSNATYYLYSSDDNIISTTNVNTEYFVFNNLSAGTYYVKVQDIGGCSGLSETFIINESTQFDFGFYSIPNSQCYTEPTGKLFVTGVTANQPYTYLWEDGSTNNTLTGLTNGAYSVTVTDSNRCSVTKTGIIETVPLLSFVNVVAANPTCFLNNGSLTFSLSGGTAPFYYSANTGLNLISYSNDFVLSGISSGVYSLRVTDAGLCTTIATSSLSSDNGVLGITVTSNNSYCNKDNGSIRIAVNGGVAPYTYTLTYENNDSIIIVDSLSSYTFTGLTSGDYVISFSDVSDCLYSEDITIINEDKFTLNVSTTGTTCGAVNGSAYLYVTNDVSDTYIYKIDGVTVYPESVFTGVTVNNLASGTHIAEVIDSSGCAQTKTFNVDNSNILDFSLYSTSCGNGDEGVVYAYINNGNPPFTYYWSDNVSGNPQTTIASGLTGGSYSLTIVDDNGCSLSRNISLDCYKVYTSYQTYNVSSENVIIETQTKRGMLQLLNEGFEDIVADNIDCILEQSEFFVDLSILPSGYTDSVSFYVGTDRADVPSDSDWYNSVKDILESVDGITEVLVSETNNEIIIKSDPVSRINEQIIKVDLRIEYIVNCVS